MNKNLLMMAVLAMVLAVCGPASSPAASTAHRWTAEENLVILDLDNSLDNHFRKG